MSLVDLMIDGTTIQRSVVPEQSDVMWGCARRISDPSDFGRALRETNLDWTVSKRDAYIEVDGRAKKLDGVQLLTRDDNHKYFASVSGAYKPMQHTDMLNLFRSYCEQGSLKLTNLGSLDDGNVIFAQASPGLGFSIEGRDHNMMIMLVLSHNGKIAFTAKPTDVCVVCWNTLMMALDQRTQSIKLRQTTNWELRIADVRALIESWVQTNNAQKARMQCYANTKLDDTEIPVLADMITRTRGNELLNAITEVSAMPRIHRENVIDAIIDRMGFDAATRRTIGDAKEMKKAGKLIVDTWLTDETQPGDSLNHTAYGMLAGVTRYLDHHAGRNTDTRMQSAWFGEGNKAKQGTVALLDVIAATVN